VGRGHCLVTPDAGNHPVAPLSFGKAVRAELACLAEFTHFIRRHRRYLAIFLLLYWHSLFAWRARRGMRVAFCLAQRIDDILDGDRPVPEQPLIAAARIRTQVATGNFAVNREGVLAHAVAWELDARAGADESPRQDFLALIDTLCRDRERIDARRVLDGLALEKHLSETFTRSLDLHLLLAGSRIRSRDVAPVIPCFTRCSALRDLDEDLAHGLVNIPCKLLAACNVAGLPSGSMQLRNHAMFCAWVRRETAESLAALNEADQLLLAWPDQKDPGLRVLRIFTRSMRDFFLRRVRRLYPEAFAPTTES
jgi:hypothetical protein